jgi:hypothetical protein
MNNHIVQMKSNLPWQHGIGKTIFLQSVAIALRGVDNPSAWYGLDFRSILKGNDRIKTTLTLAGGKICSSVISKKEISPGRHIECIRPDDWNMQVLGYSVSDLHRHTGSIAFSPGDGGEVRSLFGHRCGGVIDAFHFLRDQHNTFYLSPPENDRMFIHGLLSMTDDAIYKLCGFTSTGRGTHSYMHLLQCIGRQNLAVIGLFVDILARLSKNARAGCHFRGEGDFNEMIRNTSAIVIIDDAFLLPEGTLQTLRDLFPSVQFLTF